MYNLTSSLNSLFRLLHKARITLGLSGVCFWRATVQSCLKARVARYLGAGRCGRVCLPEAASGSSLPTMGCDRGAQGPPARRPPSTAASTAPTRALVKVAVSSGGTGLFCGLACSVLTQSGFSQTFCHRWWACVSQFHHHLIIWCFLTTLFMSIERNVKACSHQDDKNTSSFPHMNICVTLNVSSAFFLGSEVAHNVFLVYSLYCFCYNSPNVTLCHSFCWCGMFTWGVPGTRWLCVLVCIDMIWQRKIPVQMSSIPQFHSQRWQLSLQVCSSVWNAV